ncbi:BON domain-containing protein [Pseudoxanthomonas suwonensis]|uniref:BON domain-containing protein n=1 Tax=Pseudoxanthomonas suwonensis TaxID=314722 RepID=UPI000464EB8D|nr:BON domain-containing protein [Pseudoxanthomonas suwonensis]
MRRNASIFAVALVAALGANMALANDEKPEKKPAADADSSQPVNDTWITTKVKSSLLADSDVSGTRIEVDTVDGVVYLTGTAETQAQADKAKQIAQGIDGVSKVDSTKVKVTGSR